MRWLIFGIFLVIAAATFQLLPRYEMAAGSSGGVVQMDKWTGAVRSCTQTCTPWIGGTGLLSTAPPA